MTKSIREEIEGCLWNDKIDDEIKDKLVNLFRSWALEEREDERKKVIEEIKKKNAPEIERVNEYINEYIKEMEKKIEEAGK